MEMGAQLYTLRDYTRDLDGFATALQKVADIGYRTVQVSGTCTYESDWLREQLKKTGLRCVVTHYDTDRMQTEPEKVTEEHKQFSCEYIGLGYIPGGLAGGMDDYIRFRENFLPVGRTFAKNGCQLLYHNHNMEFAKSDNGKIYLERMIEDFSPEEMGFTIDTYWVQAGGGDPVQWLKRLAGRVPCVHLKDMAYDQDGIRMAPVYEGNMNFDAILKACEEAGTKYLLVEQDNCYGEDPFDCLTRSYKNLKSRGLE